MPDVPFEEKDEFDTKASKSNGRTYRRCGHKLCHCRDLCGASQRLCAACKRVRKIYERGNFEEIEPLCAKESCPYFSRYCRIVICVYFLKTFPR